MKLPILFAVWFPSTFLLLIFSIYSLINYQSPKSVEKNVLGFTDEELSLEAYYNPKNIPDTDFRILVLRKFFTDIKSPLADHAEVIIKQSDQNGLDYALIPAIAMQESGGCKIIPPNSYNCWGFGIYGDKSISFKNYEDAISRVAKTLKESYIKKGLTNATLVEDRWTPRSIGQWSYSVNFFIGKIREIERQLQ